jgi:hypothetical protein
LDTLVGDGSDDREDDHIEQDEDDEQRGTDGEVVDGAGALLPGFGKTAEPGSFVLMQR